MTPPSRVALVVRGGWDGHQPVETTDSFIPFLEENGYAVRVEGDTSSYADADYLATVDLIVQVNTMSTIPEDELRGLTAAVRAGTGLTGWHGGIVDAYRNSPDYLLLVGGQFAQHPPRTTPDLFAHDGTDHFVDHSIEIVPDRRDHPIVAGLDDFTLTTEQYWVLSDELNDVLATTTFPARDFDPWSRPVTCPAVWTREWGEGRIVVCTPGHRLDVVEHPSVRAIIERGMLWASR